MINEPRTYRHATLQFILVMALFVVFSISFSIVISNFGDVFLILFVILLGIILLIMLYSMTQKITISDDGISSRTFLGEKYLRWSEVSRVSGRGYGIKLHNFDGDVAVAPSPQLPGYEEIVEWIGIKRPDLFNPMEYDKMPRSWLITIIVLAASPIFIWCGFYLSRDTKSVFIFQWVIPILGVLFIGYLLTSPQSVTIQGNAIVIGYLFSQKTLLADEIISVELRFSESNKRGKSYFILLTQTNKKTESISELSPSLPIVYLVLKNWHGKNSAIGQTNQRN